MNMTASRELARVQTPTVQNRTNASLFQRVRKRQSLFKLSIRQSIAEASLILSQKLFDTMALRMIAVIRAIIDPISKMVVQRSRLRRSVGDGSHLCILRSLAMKRGHVLTHSLLFSI